MWQRLTLAKDLLRQDGVIFVSIDDNEIFALGMLMNKIFGESNFVANVIWEKRYSPQNAAKWFSENHDYIMVYALNKENWFPNLLERTDEMNARYRNLDNDARGVWKPTDATAQAGHGTESQFYILTAPNGKTHQLPNGRCWVYTEEVMKRMIAEDRVWFGATGNNTPAIKRFLSNVKQGVAAKTIWSCQEVGHNQEAKKEIKALFPNMTVPFDTPKPVRLIERILRLATAPGDLILDFFAGSGTTAHAVLKLNAEDGGKRRFILVSNTEATPADPEKNLCRDVCARRIRRVIEGYGDTPGLGGDFAYLRTRRISPEELLGIEHTQIWNALQLLHCGSLAPFDASRDFLWTGDAHQALAYVPRFSETFLPALRKAIRATESVTIYSWQTEFLRQSIRSPRAQHEPIPDALARKFGLRR
jgi:adenine-specific DNA-methyltransferase